MKFCSDCGGGLTEAVPLGDNRLRHVCTACDAVHYQNPKVVVGAIPEWRGELLLCRRAIEPRRGFWTLPAGFMEIGEGVQQGAARETLEEANARIEVGPLYTLFSLPRISQVYLLFRARLLDDGFSAGDESLEVRLFHPDQLPWDELAFQVMEETLRHYVADLRHGSFRSREGIIERLPGEPPRHRTTLLG